MAGIGKTIESIGDIEKLAVDAITAVKALNSGLGGYFKVFVALLKVAGDAKDLAEDGPQALPELQDLDAAEVAQVGAAAYGLVQSVLAALKT